MYYNDYPMHYYHWETLDTLQHGERIPDLLSLLSLSYPSRHV